MKHSSSHPSIVTNNNHKCAQCSVRLIAFCGILEDEDILQLETISKDKNIPKGKSIFLQGDEVYCK